MTSPALLEKLAAYVPTPVAHAIYENPRVLTEPTARRFPAVILFSDISGFTALSELLGGAGPTGAEELTHLINQYFTQMIHISQAYHGQVVKFSGDALTVLFAADDSLERAARRAGECALAMQAKMSDFTTLTTSRGPASLTMKVGIGAGEVLECSVGGALGRWEYMVAGEPLIQVAIAQYQAQAGDVIVSGSVWRNAQNFFAGEKKELGFVRLELATTLLPPQTPVTLDWSLLGVPQQQTAAKALECFVPGAIRERLVEQAGWLAELRRMTVVFIGIGGFDYEAANAGERLQNFLQATQELVYRFEGSLNKVAVDDKGTVLLVLFGAPPFSHEDNPTRAVAFALDLQTVARRQALRMSIGITEGTIFAGPVGAPNRREYTVIGDEVNLAARLMQHGKTGTIIISDKVKRKAGPRFVTESLGQIPIKGKAQTPIVHLVKGEQGVQDEFVMRYLFHDTPLIGRQEYLGEARRVMAQVEAGNLQAIFVEGEHGLGKSRLVSEMVREWLRDGGVGYGGKCVSYDRQIIYRVWREVLAAIFGLTPNLSPQRQLARLAAGIADLEDPPGQPDYWARRLPLLADVIGLEIPENDFTAAISGELRRNNTFAIIEMLLRREVARHPLLIVLEDIHWADELSLSLAAYLARTMAGSSLLLVLVYRPMSPADMAPLVEVKALPYAHTLRLQPLSNQESLELVKPIFDSQTLPGEIEQILLQRGQGNPLFLQEIARAIVTLSQENGQSNKLLQPLNLPESVQDVILTHIDRLADAEKLTLKVASVIGVRFQRTLLANVHPANYTGLALSAQLDALERENLIRLDIPAPQWEYNFFNVTVQEVVYEGLLLAQRRQLHENVANILESLVPDEIEQLAFHFSRSNNREKALYYLRAAAEKAKREYANHAAINYYTEILTLLTRSSAATATNSMISEKYWDTLLERAKLYHLLGGREQELEDLNTLGIVAEALQDKTRRALAAQRWGYLYQNSGDYDSGLELVERSVELAQQAGAEALMGEGYNLWGNLLYLRGDYDAASAYLQEALLIAQKYQNRHVQADCLHNLGVVADYQADYPVALYFFQEAIDLRRVMGDPLRLGASLTHQGQVYYILGQYMAAQCCFDEALALHRASGDRAGEALAQLNLGQIQRSLGNYSAAHALLQSTLETYQSIDDPRYKAMTLCHLGLLYCRVNQYDKAVGVLAETLEILAELNDPHTLRKALIYLGWTLTQQNKALQARSYIEQALKLSRDIQREALRIEALAHLGRIALLLGDKSLADTCAKHIISFLEKQVVEGIEHPGLVYLICHEIMEAQGEAEKAAWIVGEAQRYLSGQLAQFDDPITQHNFTQNIPEHRELLAKAKK
jgi:predicted ATPase/class 3 adenylate cyclase